MKRIKSLLLIFTSLVLSSCGKAQVKPVTDPFPYDPEPDTTVYDDNDAVDLRSPQFRGPGDEEEEEEEESFVVDKVILHYYNEDGNCNKPGTAGRAFYVWVPGIDGQEYSNEYNYEASRFEYSSDGTLMTITIDMVNDPIFKDFYGCTSIMYIIKYKMESPANLNWGGQSEDVELKFSAFPPNKERVVEVWSTPAAGGGIAQFDSEEKTKVEGVKLAKFTDWKTISCELSANAHHVDWELYAFDETYFKEKAKKRPAIKKNYKVLTGENETGNFTISFTYSAHINAVYCIESADKDGIAGLKKTVYVSFEKLYGTPRFEQYYTPKDVTDLGVTYTSTQTTFKVWSPVAANVSLYLYNTDTSAAYDGSDKYKGWHMNYTPGGIWTLTVKGDLAHDDYKYYNYYVDTWSTSGVCMDPYATACGACGIRGMVYDKSETNPVGWDSFDSHLDVLHTPQELTIYEVHVQDFTGDESWVSNAGNKRGTYNAFVESGTRLVSDSTIKTGFDHLKEIGIGAVQLVPVFDSDNDEVKNTKYNWGYNPLNYNCVEGAYSSNPHDGLARISEFKNMVNELGKAKMRTIMDVVYNHVSSPTASCFNKLMPRYYFRYDDNGELYDGSGCHNEFKSEATMARKYIVDSICMWAKEYKIKGFRFDLMALIDVETMRAVKKAVYEIDPTIYLYGEGWTAAGFHGGKTWVGGVQIDSLPTAAVDGTGYQVYSELYNSDDHDKYSCYLGAFDDSSRNALRGGNDLGWGMAPLPGHGFIAKGKSDLSYDYRNKIQKLVWGERGDGGGGNPKQMIAYASCHDNWTLRDQLYYTLGDSGDNAGNIYDVIHGTLACQSIIFASNAAAFMLGGEELMRSKEIIVGDGKNGTVTAEEFEKIPANSYETLYGHKCSHNSYNSPIGVNSFKWENKRTLTVDGVTVDMKSENLTGKYADLVQLHKMMPKYDYAKLQTIGPGHTSTNGHPIGDVSWPGGWEWNDEGTIGIQFDDWFIFIAARQFGYMKNPVWESGWQQKMTFGTVGVDYTNLSLNLGDEGYDKGLASAIYYRG